MFKVEDSFYKVAQLVVFLAKLVLKPTSSIIVFFYLCAGLNLTRKT